MWRPFCAAALLTLLSAWALASPAQVPDNDASWMAPPDAARKANPLADRPDAAGGGRKLYQQRCANCHGDDGRGSSKAPDLTRAAAQQQPDGALFWKVSSGNTRKGMPAFSFLPEAQRWQLVLHVRAMAGPNDALRN